MSMYEISIVTVTHLPTNAATLVYIIKDATDPKIQPTSNEPKESGIGLLVTEEIPIQPAATITPTTAAKSSNKTTFTLGSWPRNTGRKNKTIVTNLNNYVKHCVDIYRFYKKIKTSFR